MYIPKFKEFKNFIGNYPNITRSYEEALETADPISQRSEDREYHVSKYCRAYFFFSYLKVERELSDSEERNMDDEILVPFKLSNIQFNLLEKFEERIAKKKKFRHRVMKCRRAQVSTLYLAIEYHMIRFFENHKGLCFADRLETSRKLQRILQTFFMSDSLIRKPPEGIRTLCEGLYLHHGVKSDLKDTLKDSYILLGSAEQKNSGIGGSLDSMIWSEASLSNDAKRHWTTISPSLKGAKYDIAESTPSFEGQDDIIFKEFETPSDNCDRIFIPWTHVKDYQFDDKQKVGDFVPYVDHHLYGKEGEIMVNNDVSIGQMLWRRFKLDEMKDLNEFRRVFPISQEEAFYSGSSSYFNRDLIELCREKQASPNLGRHLFSDQGSHISIAKDDLGVWNIYENTLYGSNYLVACDTSEGGGGPESDFSMAMVFELSDPIREVASFREKYPPEVFAEQVAAAAKYYNGAHVVPEKNNTGIAFIGRILQIYHNVYREQRLSGGMFMMTTEYGFRTTSTSKPSALSALQDRMRKGLIIRTDTVFKELQKFRQIGLKYQAASGFQDDSISCLWLMAMAIYQCPSLIKIPQILNGQLQSAMSFLEPKIERDEWAYTS
jgi:hypothetical protein